MAPSPVTALSISLKKSESPPSESDSSSSPPSDSSSSSPSDSSSSSPPSDLSSSSPPSDSSNSSSSSSSPPAPETESSPPPPESSNSKSPWSSPPQQNSSPAPPQGNNNNNNNNYNNGRGHSPPSPPHNSAGALSPPSPPRSAKSPPSSSSTPDSSRSSNSPASPSSGGGVDGKGGKIIIGAAVGVGLLIIMIMIVCVRSARKKKGKLQYYGDSPKGNQQYYNSTEHPNWHNNPQGPDHVVKLSQQEGGGWGAPPPPPPTVSSGEDSSLYSGPHRPPLPPPSPIIALGFNQNTFTYEELAAATGGFAQANLLGQGGFGYVYKGVLPNGKEVAVKSLKSGSGQGEREFQAEVDIISRVHHRYLVSLVGYCIADGQRMLVYEFVPNNTLEYHLHDKSHPVMDFSTRLRIALGSAKGLAYIHEDCDPRVIHRDIKAANILLDYNFEAKVADFGLAKLSSDTYTHVSTRVMGTFGYLAPEYASSGKLTEKSDVFSFGIMLLELLTGKRPVDCTGTMEDTLVDWARPLLLRALDDGNFDELADPRLEGNYNPQEIVRMVACAAASIRHSARKRPKMSQIVRALEGDVSLDDLNEGIKPGQSSIFTTGGSSDYSQSSYQADLKKFRQIALSSTEFPSSEYGTSSNDSREMTPRKPKSNI